MRILVDYPYFGNVDSMRLGSLFCYSLIAMLLGELRAQKEVLDLLDEHCIRCHNPEKIKGELDLESIYEEKMSDHPEIWEKVIKRLEARDMPPHKSRKRPEEAQYQETAQSLIEILDASAKADPQPGREATFRRLTRREYQNAVRDLLGVQIDAAAFLPKDEESHGFDNITTGGLSPTLVDRYISAAQKVSRVAVGSRSEKVDGYTYRVPADVTQEKHIEGLPLGTRGGALLPYTFPQDGEYEIEVLLARDRNEKVEGLRGTHEMEMLLDSELLETFTVKTAKDHSTIDKHLKKRLFVKAGRQNLGVTFLPKGASLLENKRQPYESHYNLFRHPRLSPAIYQVSITGPYGGKGASETASREQIFGKAGDDPSAILKRLMKLAYRRAITEEDLTKPMAFYERAGDFEAGIQAALESILVSPEFLFRVERDPAEGGEVYRITDLELASRLSFFLWSSLPDEELLNLAIANQLSDSAILEEQVRRMLADERAESLVTNFASQWLHLRNLGGIVPDLRLFPDFDDNLRQAFLRESELFVESVFREDRSVLDLLKADYTFLNERLAKHYGIPGVFGSRFRRVELRPENQRGGLLRQGSILTVTSYATRTSPVLRGNWVLENILGTPAPPPPPDIPSLDDVSVDASLSMRDKLAKHRADPACASCHDRMDPVGFALESFDAVGRWRDFENGAAIDISGGLPDGRTVTGLAELEEGLLEKPHLFARTISEKLLTFALGRGLEAHDAPAIREIVRRAAQDEYHFSAIILGITESVPFQQRSKSP
ncbi:MAG: DUF1592 domain-containing protein [Akkermansiaceae bacterium]